MAQFEHLLDEEVERFMGQVLTPARNPQAHPDPRVAADRFLSEWFSERELFKAKTNDSTVVSMKDAELAGSPGTHLILSARVPVPNSPFVVSSSATSFVSGYVISILGAQAATNASNPLTIQVDQSQHRQWPIYSTDLAGTNFVMCSYGHGWQRPLIMAAERQFEVKCSVCEAHCSSCAARSTVIWKDFALTPSTEAP